jgi:hypothetical protein
MRKTYFGKVFKLLPNQVFVYGANTEFRHGKGSALYALKFGAKYGVGGFVGLFRHGVINLVNGQLTQELVLLVNFIILNIGK